MLTVTDISGVLFPVLGEVKNSSCFAGVGFESAVNETSELFGAIFPGTIAISCRIAETLPDAVNTSCLMTETLLGPTAVSCLVGKILFEDISCFITEDGAIVISWLVVSILFVGIPVSCVIPLDEAIAISWLMASRVTTAILVSNSDIFKDFSKLEGFLLEQKYKLGRS